jgi:isopentenyl-diphosphate delta-isomerase
MSIEQVILVDENDNEMGTMEKMEAHQKGVLHRAFSVLIFNSHGDLLIQRRSNEKYHSAGLWTNTCCSHPRPGESIQVAAQRRLKEEMGIDLMPSLSHKFIYTVSLENGLIENEIDYVFTGTFNGIPNVNSHEVSDWKFISLSDLQMKMHQKPEEFTFWFKAILDEWKKLSPAT